MHSTYSILFSFTFISSFSHSLFWPFFLSLFSAFLRHSRFCFLPSFITPLFRVFLFYYVLICSPYYLVLPFTLFLSFGLISVKISDNILTSLYSQCLSACYSSNTAGESYYNKLLQFVVTFRFYLKLYNGDGNFAGRPMLVYAYISTATRMHLAKYVFNLKMFGMRCREL